jgi:hypothetical protein
MDKFQEQLDRLALRITPSKLRTVRTVSILTGLIGLAFVVIVWLLQVMLIDTNPPTMQWLIWFQIVPWVTIVLPAYYGWYLSDLSLLRNYYNERKGWF